MEVIGMEPPLHSPARAALASSPAWTVLGCLALTFVCGGATCFNRAPTIQYPPPPAVFNTTPTLEQIVNRVNRADLIQKLHTNSATVEVLSLPAVPQLSGTLAIDRPRGLRLQAAIPFFPNAGLDLGSNDQMFWMRVPESIGSTAFFYAGHEAFRSTGNRQILPVEPTWLIDAFGLTHIDPNQVIEGPTPTTDGAIQIIDQLYSGTQVFRRVLTLDAESGVVLKQELYDPAGRQLASSQLSRHEHYPSHQVSLPHDVRIRMDSIAGRPIEMRMQIGIWSVNALLSDDPTLFAAPDVPSDKKIDLAAPPPQPPLAGEVPPGYVRAADHTPLFRGSQLR